MTTPQPLRLLLVEDNENDALLVLANLRAGGLDIAPTRVDRANTFTAALTQQTWDFIIADYRLPAFNALAALEICRHHQVDIPFILVSGTIGDEAAADCMRAGAHDYVLKDHLPRLVPAIRRELREAEIRAERQRDLDRLRASERRFASIFDTSPLGIAISRADDAVIIDANSTACALIGRTRGDLVGHSALELGFWIDAAERAQAVNRMLTDREACHLERAWRDALGRAKTIHLSMNPIDLDGRRHLLVMLNDVTERDRAAATLRESEERYRLLVENSTDLIAEITREGIVAYASPNYEALLHLLPAQLKGNSLFGAIHPDDRTRVVAQLQSSDRRAVVYRFEDGAGREHWLESSGRTFTASGGEERIVVFSRDITEKMTAEQSRRLLESQLRQAQKMEAIGTLAGGIAHDFNNILTGIVGNVQVAQFEIPAGSRASLCLNEALKAGMRARDLVAQILTFSRQREQPRAATQLGSIVREALRLLRASLPANIQFITQIEPNLPPILCDPSQIHQVLMNLGTNAAYAMRERGGILRVALRPVMIDDSVQSGHPRLRPGPGIRLTVSDTGCGMDAITRERLFEPFFTTKPVGEGTGLGLAVVHGIVENHDARITVESQPGQGTTFDLYFAAITETAADAPAQPSRPPPPGHGERILLVDDEPAITTVGARMLEKLGYAVVSFSHPAQALVAFKQRPDAFQVLITDLTMPGMSGLELAREVLASRPNLPVLMTSGRLHKNDAERARAAGVRQTIAKPFSYEALAESLAQALNGVH
jgi:two-component system cell cycle sensor histidine kinase/response regulator CckA